MFRKHIETSDGVIIQSNLPISCQNCAKCHYESQVVNCSLNNEKRRQGIVFSSNYSVYLCTSSKDLIQSSKLFKTYQRNFIEFLPELVQTRIETQEEVNQEVKRLIHNLTSINAHSIQELYNLVPQEILTLEFKDQIRKISNYIQSDTHLAAATFLRIAKHNASLKTEFAVFNKLYETNPNLQIKKHVIRKVLFNLLYIFFQDFTDNNIYVDVEQNYDQIFFDYESIHVAFYHIFENATKYALHREPIIINFEKSEKTFDVNIEMTSIQITDEDVTKIFQPNFSGYYARKLKKAGNGIGLNVVQRILKLNKAELILKRNIDNSFNKYIANAPFERNQFKIRFYLE